jgi:hypothetical protein
MRSFAHLWQQDEFSDVDIVLTGPHDSSSTAEDSASKLATFPGHSVLLGDSPFFKAQVCCLVENINSQALLWQCLRWCCTPL